MAYRIIGTVQGLGTNDSDSSLQMVVSDFDVDAGKIQIHVPPGDTGNFSIGQSLAFYIALNPTERSEIEGAAGLTVTPFGTQD